MKTLIRNGILCFEDRLATADIIVADEKIADIRSGIAASSADEVIDAGGMYVLPGLIDIHTHVDDRIGAFELADTYESASRIAVENGITTFLTFVTQQPGETLSNAVGHARRKAEGRSHANYMWHLTPTQFDDSGWDEIATWIGRGFRTFKFYTTYKRAGIFTDYDRLEMLFSRLAPKGVQFLIHAEDEAVLATAGSRSPDLTDAFSHTLLRPAEAEIEAIRQLIHLAEKHSARVHVVHVSTPEGADLIDAARPRIQMTCETAPQYLFLDENQLRGANGHRWLCSPPLRNGVRRTELWERARAGKIDLFATDHCAFFRKDKDTQTGDIRDIPNGLPGIGALVPMMLELYTDRMPDGLVDYALRLSTNPARVTGFYPRKGTIAVGSDADLLLMKPSGERRAVRSSHQDVFEPYPGSMTNMQVCRVLIAGETIVKDGRLVKPEVPRGRCVCQW